MDQDVVLKMIQNSKKIIEKQTFKSDFKEIAPLQQNIPLN